VLGIADVIDEYGGD